jgi:DNA-binding MarR family transcriptional regulator
MEYLKEEFYKLNKEILLTKSELEKLNGENSIYRTHLNELELFLFKLNQDFLNFKNETTSKINFLLKKPNNNSDYTTNKDDFPTNITFNPTNQQTFNIKNVPFKTLKGENIVISKGNEGVPTDRPTDQQTDKNSKKELKFESKEIMKISQIENVSNILNSLDNLKKEIRIKFKKLTDQEALVFSVVYQFDEEEGYSTYKSLSNRLNLTESSIRDYIGKLIKKGIPIEKIKVNNKEIQLKISETLKRIASLNTILQLREI